MAAISELTQGSQINNNIDNQQVENDDDKSKSCMYRHTLLCLLWISQIIAAKNCHFCGLSHQGWSW